MIDTFILGARKRRRAKRINALMPAIGVTLAALAMVLARIIA